MFLCLDAPTVSCGPSSTRLGPPPSRRVLSQQGPGYLWYCRSAAFSVTEEPVQSPHRADSQRRSPQEAAGVLKDALAADPTYGRVATQAGSPHRGNTLMKVCAKIVRSLGERCIVLLA